jgi:Zn-dependent protease with chaperone function
MITPMEKYSGIYQKWNFFVKISLCLLMHITLSLIKINYQYIPFNILLFLNLVFLMMFSTLSIYALFSMRKIIKFFNLKKDNERALPPYLLQLSKEMDVDIKTYQISKNLRNAGMLLNRKLILGDFILDTFTENEITAIVAHEFGHKKNFINKSCMAILGLIITSYIMLNYVVHINRIFLWITNFSYFYMLMFPFFWDSELSADAIAVRYTSLDDLKTALVKLFPRKINSFSFSHPSITYRIERLKKMNESRACV